MNTKLNCIYCLYLNQTKPNRIMSENSKGLKSGPVSISSKDKQSKILSLTPTSLSKQEGSLSLSPPPGKGILILHSSSPSPSPPPLNKQEGEEGSFSLSPPPGKGILILPSSSPSPPPLSKEGSISISLSPPPLPSRPNGITATARNPPNIYIQETFDGFKARLDKLLPIFLMCLFFLYTKKTAPK